MLHEPPPTTGTKRKIRVEYKEEKWRQKERRAKLNLAFHLSFSPKCCLSATQLGVRCFKCFHCSFPQPSFKSQKERGRGWGINALQMCLSPLAWIKDFFQVRCISSRPNLCVFRNATWQSGQGCSFAVLFMSNPSFCSPMLSLTDVFSGSQHTENTWQTEAPGLLGESAADDIGETIAPFPRRLQHPPWVETG